MALTTMTSREFNQHAGEAKKAALAGPVFITDRGQPSHVLLSIAEYRKLTGGVTTLAEALAQQEGADIDFEPPRVSGVTRTVDL
ncbi:prevent-host-death family protein [Cupriavidus gilardii J11]|uniref:Antitoxin n=1 Tax=Cupriavidus gilardii J11 TaxID=936133 RepID=A0A562BPA1_9BURK|nr:type II toxin-antitoxin system prevent-host-death family antitoxin [Cupriavidus gilardii]TWG87007.1 prevent-host-death family protein [Cupriavidus gilardii J11]